MTAYIYTPELEKVWHLCDIRAIEAGYVSADRKV